MATAISEQLSAVPGGREMHSHRPTLPLSLAAVPSGRPGRCPRAQSHEKSAAGPAAERRWERSRVSLSRFAVSCIEAASRRPGAKPAPARPRCRQPAGSASRSVRPGVSRSLTGARP